MFICQRKKDIIPQLYSAWAHISKITQQKKDSVKNCDINIIFQDIKIFWLHWLHDLRNERGYRK